MPFSVPGDTDGDLLDRAAPPRKVEIHDDHRRVDRVPEVGGEATGDEGSALVGVSLG